MPVNFVVVLFVCFIRLNVLFLELVQTEESTKEVIANLEAKSKELEEGKHTAEPSPQEDKSREEISTLKHEIENLEEKVRSAAEEKEDLVAGFNSMKQEYMMMDFEKQSKIESSMTEIEELKEKAFKNTELLEREKEASSKLSETVTKLQGRK